MILSKSNKISYSNEFFCLLQDADKPEADEVFHILTSDENRNYITREEIVSLSTARLAYVCAIFNKRHQRVHDEL